MGKWGTAFDIIRDVIVPNRNYLDIFEKEVLFFIYCRTRMFGKEWERISLNQFMRGYLSENYEIGGVTMSANKLLECLKHLKGKQIIEVRSTGISTANEYRIREAEELNTTHIETYVQRYQPKRRARFLNRAQHIPNIRNQIEDRRIRSVAEFMLQGTIGNEGRVPSETSEGVPSETRELNIPIKKQPISTPSRKTATRGFRQILITK